jgi:hypothetical protein
VRTSSIVHSFRGYTYSICCATVQRDINNLLERVLLLVRGNLSRTHIRLHTVSATPVW